MCSIAAVGGTVQNLKLFLSIDLKLSQYEVARIASLVLFSSLAGRIMMGYLADKWSRKHVMILIYAIVAAAIPLLFFADRPWARPLFAVLFGIGLGGDYMTRRSASWPPGGQARSRNYSTSRASASEKPRSTVRQSWACWHPPDRPHALLTDQSGRRYDWS